MKFRGYGINTKKITLMIFGFWILTSISGFQFIPMTIQTADAVSERIVGYFPYWKSADINSIDYSKLTEIIYFHIWPNYDGSLNKWDISMLDLHKIRDRAHVMGVAISISVGLVYVFQSERLRYGG